MSSFFAVLGAASKRIHFLDVFEHYDIYSPANNICNSYNNFITNLVPYKIMH